MGTIGLHCDRCGHPIDDLRLLRVDGVRQWVCTACYADAAPSTIPRCDRCGFPIHGGLRLLRVDGVRQWVCASCYAAVQRKQEQEDTSETQAYVTTYTAALRCDRCGSPIHGDLYLLRVDGKRLWVCSTCRDAAQHIQEEARHE